MPHIGRVRLASRMGRSPIVAYDIWDEGNSLSLQPLRDVAQGSTGWHGHVGHFVRLPKDPADMRALCSALCSAVLTITKTSP